jgi:hypothetical protein
MTKILTIINFIKNQWLGSIVILIWLLTLLIPNKDLSIDKIKTEVKIKEKQYIIDTLYKNNTSIITKIKYIKQKEYDTIKIVDTIPINELQKYFSNRYTKSGTTR